jgi:hypothetical protein
VPLGDPLIIPAEEQPAPPVADPVACSTCLYFRAFSPEERNDARGRILADGWCMADPPTPSVRELAGPLTANRGANVVIEPMHRPVRAADFCRLWRQDFAGDVSLAIGDALESIDASLGRLVHYISEAVNAGRKG